MIKRTIKQFCVLGACLAIMAPFTQSYANDDWPARPIRMIVAQPPGGATDAVARLVADRLAKEMGQQIVVENKAGASGTIGAAAVARSAPDGYTFLLGASTEVVVSPAAGQKTTYNAETAFDTIGIIGDTPLAIVVNPKVPAKTLQEVVQQASTSDGSMNYGSPGYGSSMHFAAEALQLITKSHLTHIPYKGAAPVLTDVLGGQVPIGITGLPPTLPFAKAGQLRIIAVTSGRRSSLLPNVPTVEEALHIEDFRFSNWWGLFAPAGTPNYITKAITKMLRASLSDPILKKRLLENGVEMLDLYGSEAQSFMESERRRYRNLAKEAGLSMK